MINLANFLYCWIRKKVYFSKHKKKMNRVMRQYKRAKEKLNRDLFT
jgi:hypothetical protein